MKILIPLLLLLFSFSHQAQSACSAPDEFLVTIPEQFPDAEDICPRYDNDPYFDVIFNYGTKPEWVDDESFAFIDNNVGNVYLYNTTTKIRTPLTDHFAHSGFNRVHKLANNDLLLVGTLGGSLPDDFHPLIPHETNMFVGDMYVLQFPYNQAPVALGEKAWEGIAVAKQSMKIAYAQNPNEFYYSEEQDYACNTAVGGFVRSTVTGIASFFASALSLFGIEIDLSFITYGINSLCHYALSDGKLKYAEIHYDNNNLPYLTNQKVLIHKYSTRNGFILPYIVSSLEAQNFIGEYENKLSFTSYGPMDFVGTPNVVDLSTHEFTTMDDVFRYAEWEGVHPSGTKAVIEVDPSANPFTLSTVDNFIYNIPDHLGYAYSEKVKNLIPLPKKHMHELIFSPNGNKLLGTSNAEIGSGPSQPGYGTGIVIHDLAQDMEHNPAEYKKIVSPMAIWEPLREIVSYNNGGQCLERIFDFWDWTDWFGGFDNISWRSCNSSLQQKWYFADEKQVYQSAQWDLVPQCMAALDKPVFIFWNRTDLDLAACWRNEAKRIQFDGTSFKDSWTGKGLYSTWGSAGFEYWGPGLHVQENTEQL